MSFQKNLAALYQKKGPLRTKAWDRFLELGLPNKKMELYRYVRLRDLYQHRYTQPSPDDVETIDIKALVYPECSTSFFVFVNGHYSASLSHAPQGIIAIPLSKAFDTYSSFLTPRVAKLIKEEVDPFALLNTALHGEGLFLYLPPRFECKSPVQIIHVVVGNGEPLLLSPRLHLALGKESNLQLCITQKIQEEAIWINGSIDVALEERASLNLTTICEERGWHLEALRATLKKQSLFKSYAITNGGASSRQDYTIHLMGEESEASLYGVWGLKEARQHHVNVLIDHHEPRCTSLQTFKGILSDRARSSFDGKIYVRKKAQQTKAYQLNNNLLLSKRASANSKPNLEIFADDVKASHGATVGQLDEEQLFYLKTRGLSSPLARQLLVRGFSREIIESIPHPSARKEALSLIDL